MVGEYTGIWLMKGLRPACPCMTRRNSGVIETEKSFDGNDAMPDIMQYIYIYTKM
jgi:hypothetical protein